MPPIEHDVKMVLRSDGKWVLSIPCDPEYTRVHRGPDHKRNPVVALDPGCRTFQTAHDPIGRHTKDHGTANDLANLRQLRDKAQVLTDRYCANERKGNIHGHARAWHKHKQLRDKLHRDIIGQLHRGYDNIFMGDMNSHCLGRKEWANYRFKQQLKSRCNGSSVRFIEQNESWTSKTCGRCVERNTTLGTNKVFECRKCHLVTGRDKNAARNILVKNIIAKIVTK
jgi:transposase